MNLMFHFRIKSDSVWYALLNTRQLQHTLENRELYCFVTAHIDRIFTLQRLR